MKGTRHQAFVLSLMLFVTLGLVCRSPFLCLASAQASATPDTFEVSYFSHLTQSKKAALDESVRITNPGTSIQVGTNLPEALCAMIYVFDNTRDLQECCGCLVSPDELLTLSLETNLTANPLAPTLVFNSGDIEIISALQNGSPCDPTGGGKLSNGTYALNIFPAPALRAWATHVNFQSILGGGTATSVTEEQFEDSTLSSWELNNAQTLCTLATSVGGGTGVCTCGTIGG
jgi:hypothetical protein